METNVKYDLEQFLDCSDNINTDIENIETTLDTISKAVTDSSSYWAGRSHDSYVNYFNSVLSEYTEFLNKLRILKNNLTTINALYASHERNASNIK